LKIENWGEQLTIDKAVKTIYIVFFFHFITFEIDL